MKKSLLVAAALGLAAITAAGLALHWGFVDVAADTPHSPAVFRMLEFARERSISRRATDIVPPADLADPERIRRGSGNYAAMCAMCHLSPGSGNSELRAGLYPEPPDLTRAEAATAGATAAAQARQFWIIKHGIKATGMPAWSKGGMEDEAIWDLVAFLGKLPSLSESDYRALVEASDGHSHGGAHGHDAAGREAGHDHAAPVAPGTTKAPAPHAHPPGSRPHRH